MYDTPIQETNSSSYSDETVNTVKKEKCFVEKEPEEGILEESDNEIAIAGYVESNGPVKKRRTMLFSNDEKKLIEGNKMLTDESINLAMSLIHEQFPPIGCLTDSSIGKCQQFVIVPRENGVHYVFDSLFSPKIQQDVIHQMAAYSFSPENKLIIHVMPVQQQ